MARTGIDKTDVIRAREALLAMGALPTIDAIRIELGNTGSKSTIHRYLKEIDAEEEGEKRASKVAVSEAIMALSKRLAEQLQQEADETVTVMREQHQTELAALNETLSNAMRDSEQWREQAENLAQVQMETQVTLEACRAELQQRHIDHAQLNQNIEGLEAQQIKAEEHRRSLEEKHQQAREALEHFRVLAKEQREQERRQFEQQIQFLQQELRATQTTLNAKQQALMSGQEENARLAAELKHASTEWRRTEQALQDLLQVERALNVAELNNRQLEHQLTAARALEAEYLATHETDKQQLDHALSDVQRLNAELLAAQAVLAVHERLIATLQPLIIKPEVHTDVS